jgi:hypothetical protein
MDADFDPHASISAASMRSSTSSVPAFRAQQKRYLPTPCHRRSCPNAPGGEARAVGASCPLAAHRVAPPVCVGGAKGLRGGSCACAPGIDGSGGEGGRDKAAVNVCVRIRPLEVAGGEKHAGEKHEDAVQFQNKYGWRYDSRSIAPQSGAGIHAHTRARTHARTHAHTHTENIYIYIYTHIYIHPKPYVCMYVCIYICICIYVLRPNSPTHTIYYVLTL